MTKNIEQNLEAIAFVGDVLAPFYLQDPRTGDAGEAFAAMAALDPQAAAADWPFVEEAEAARCLQMMVDGLAASLDVDAAASIVGAADAAGESVDDGAADAPAANAGAAGSMAFSADDDLMWEYRRLFIGPGKKPAPPWGSVYTDHECVVFGESTLALRAWMREQGIERTTDERTPEDHIGLMLGLMAWIARNQPEALDGFLRVHLLTWSSHFLEELAQAAEHPFYEGLASLTKATLEGIQTTRGIEVEYPHYFR